MPVNEQSRAEFARAVLGVDIEAHQREMLGLGRWSDGETQFVMDESVPEGQVVMANTPFSRDSVASRIVNDIDRRNWPELSQPLVNGEPLTPGTCYTCGARGPTVPRRCGAKDCMSAVCIDLCVGCVGGATGNRPPRGIQHEWTVMDEADSDRVYFAPGLPVQPDRAR